MIRYLFTSLSLFIAFQFHLFAKDVCSKAWNDQVPSCNLTWQDETGATVGIEVAYINNDCRVHEEGELISCLQIRDCREKNSEHERYIFLDQTKVSGLCEGSEELILYGYNKSNLKGASVKLKCAKGKPSKIVLSSSQKSKECSFLGPLKIK